MLKSNINANTVKVNNDWVSLFAPFPGDVVVVEEESPLSVALEVSEDSVVDEVSPLSVVLEESEDSVVEEESPLSVVLEDSASDAVVDDVVGAVVTGPMEIMSGAILACLCLFGPRSGLRGPAAAMK